MKIFRLIIIGLVSIAFFTSCQDSLKFRLKKRLNNFRMALPGEIRNNFDQAKYDEAGKMLDEKLKAFKSYVDKFEADEKKQKFIRGDYKGLEKEIKNMAVPLDLLEFNKKMYSIINYECIPTFTGPQIIDFFKVYFKEKLASMKSIN